MWTYCSSFKIIQHVVIIKSWKNISELKIVGVNAAAPLELGLCHLKNCLLNLNLPYGKYKKLSYGTLGYVFFLEKNKYK